MVSFISFIILSQKDAARVAKLLCTADAIDRAYFHPFEFSTESLSREIGKCVKDVFFGIEIVRDRNDLTLAGFYMLRGLDEGFASPMYGVFIAPAHRQKGLASLSLWHAVSFCRLNGYIELMLKVYPENTKARQLYESMGFEICRHAPPQLIMCKKLHSN